MPPRKVSQQHGAREPERATRWREWARAFLADYQHFFAASGEHPAFGRSITYRSSAFVTYYVTNPSRLPARKFVT